MKRSLVYFATALVLMLGLVSASLPQASASILPPPDGSFEQRAEFDFMATDVAPGAMGTGKIELKVGIAAEEEDIIEDESGSGIEEVLDVELRVGARAEGLSGGMLFSLCIDGNLVDTEDADDQGRVDFDEDLEDDLVMFGNLVGLMVTIHEGASCDGGVVLHHIIMEGDLK